jgi:CheY-like chemotaxis protein
LGYASEAAENGKEALALWESRRYGAILTDCNMPEMNGYELARTIRMRESAEGRPHTVIIACTANALRGEAANCFAAGMDDYVAKPVDLTQLHEKLGHWLPPSPAQQDPKSLTASAIASNDAGPVDRSMLEQVSGGDSAMQEELLEQLHRATEQDCIRLEEAIAARDVDAVVQFSHRISGASSAVGANALAAAAGRVESAARSADVAAMVQAEDAVHRERRRLAAYVEIRRSSGK